MIKRQIQPAAPMAVLCEEARAKMGAERCFNPQCARCWPVVGPVMTESLLDESGLIFCHEHGRYCGAEPEDDRRACAHRGDGENCECNGNDQPEENAR